MSWSSRASIRAKVSVTEKPLLPSPIPCYNILMNTLDPLILKANQTRDLKAAGAVLAEFVRLAQEDARAFVPLSPEGKLPVTNVMGEKYIRAFTSIDHAGNEELTPMKLKDLFALALIEKSLDGLLFNMGEYIFVLTGWMMDELAEHITVSPEMVEFVARLLGEDDPS